MISAKEANNISFINDECREYLNSIENNIIKAAKEGRYNSSIELASFGIDIATEDGKKMANDIVDYLTNSGYSVSIDSNDRHASLVIRRNRNDSERMFNTVQKSLLQKRSEKQ